MIVVRSFSAGNSLKGPYHENKFFYMMHYGDWITISKIHYGDWLAISQIYYGDWLTISQIPLLWYVQLYQLIWRWRGLKSNSTPYVFPRLIFFIYQNFLSDRVPLRCFNAALDMIKLKGRCYPNIYNVLPGNLRIATNLATTFLLLLIMLAEYKQELLPLNSFWFIFFQNQCLH